MFMFLVCTDFVRLLHDTLLYAVVTFLQLSVPCLLVHLFGPFFQLNI